MVRNDYRRALILLRSNAPDYSGHVRLERRTLMGSMYFVLRTPENAGGLEAVLVGRNKDSYYACPLGAFRKDMRGQTTLGWNFNPRDVCGRELEQYQKIVVARKTDEDCTIVLFGNLNGFAEMNWERVRTAVCLSLEDGKARASVSEFTEPPEETEEIEEDIAEDILEELTGDEAEEEEELPRRRNRPGEQELPTEIETDAQTAMPTQPVRTAAELLGVNTDLPWPDSIEPLRRMFGTQTPVQNAPDDRYIYISAPMPAGCGYENCAIGLRAGGGAPVAVSYALRAHYTTQPPAGLEDYAWSGNGNEGWWKLEISIPDGARITNS